MEKKLQTLGLTLGESKVFVSLLKLGASKVGAIVKSSRVSYSKVYDVLERLIEKGLVSYVKIENIKYFQAAEPYRLNDYVEKKENEIRSQRNLVKEIMPNLLKIAKSQKKSSVEIFLGLKGLKSAYEILLQDAERRDVLRCFYPYDKKNDLADDFYSYLFTNISHKKIKQRSISTVDSKKRWQVKKLPKNCEFRFVPFPLFGTIDIFKNKTLIVTWSGEITGILISSQEVYHHYENYFDCLWKIAEK